MLKITVLRSPSVELNGVPLSFPFKRADALLYYMAVQKSATRQELVALLWEDYDESNGLKQLRNILYHLKKILGGDFLISPQKSLIRVNPAWELDCDYDRFMRDGDLAAYRGSFLQGFGVKRAFSFEEWMCRTADRLRDLYLERVAQTAEAAVQQDNFREAARLYARGLAEDPFNEPLAAGLMECYRRMQDYSRAAELYQGLKRHLKEELGTEPLEKTKTLYYQILNQWDAQSATCPPAPPVGQEAAFAMLNHSLEELAEDGANGRCAFLIHGEAGTGKKELVDFFLRWGAVEKRAIQRIDCLASERDIPLTPWEHLLQNLWDMADSNEILLPISVMARLESAFALTDPKRLSIGSSRAVRKLDDGLTRSVFALLDALEKLRPLLIVFENIHWMDDESLRLLDSLIHRAGGAAILLTCRDYSGGSVRAALRQIAESDRIRSIALHPLTEEQVRALLARRLGEADADRLTESFYRNTRGNLHLLRELIRAHEADAGSAAQAPETVLFGNLQGLSEQSLRAAQILSVYPGDMTSTLFLQMFGGGEKQLTHAINELIRAGIIEEIHLDGEENCYRLAHPRLREMIYVRMSVYERRPLHRQFALLLTESTEQNGGSWMEISHQYEHAGDMQRSLEYRIRELSRLTALAFVPYLYPNVQTPAAVDSEVIIAQCSACHSKLKTLFFAPEDQDCRTRLECELLEARGIAEICSGDYAQGVDSLGSVSGISNDRNELRQLRICALLGELAIRQQDAAKAERYLATGLRILERKRNEFYTAAFRRLQGCCFLLRRAYAKADYYLTEAIDTLKALPAHTGSNLLLALSYSDQGRLRRYQEKYAKAGSCFKKSISLLAGGDWSFSVWIYVHYGRTVYALEDHLTAKSLFDEACRIAEKTGKLLGRTAAESYAAIYAARAADDAAVERHLINASVYFEKSASPLETSIFYYACMIIRLMLDQFQLKGENLGKILPESAQEYAHLGIKNAKSLPDVYEVEEMQKVLRSNLRQRDNYYASDLYSKNKWFMTE